MRIGTARSRHGRMAKVRGYAILCVVKKPRICLRISLTMPRLCPRPCRHERQRQRGTVRLGVRRLALFAQPSVPSRARPRQLAFDVGSGWSTFIKRFSSRDYDKPRSALARRVLLHCSKPRSEKPDRLQSWPYLWFRHIDAALSELALLDFRYCAIPCSLNRTQRGRGRWVKTRQLVAQLEMARGALKARRILLSSEPHTLART
jgi:hypothetical protein